MDGTKPNPQGTMDEIEQAYSKLWGRPAHVILYRISGNRSAYAVSDHNGHWQPLNHRWTGRHILFKRA